MVLFTLNSFLHILIYIGKGISFHHKSLQSTFKEYIGVQNLSLIVLFPVLYFCQYVHIVIAPSPK